ncbi:KAP family P-loop NTPase fold protein [Puia dinghuensis]|uniref:KAP NTPase domain-containing protein n=1 Tax=Puia dinghuensis TaxID=1792502 RepID=A0A8J2U6L1_9BACT|nr:P-loop NTPase fold protein [Puia dinghuensis]GGA82194.1 hypothetical protein GCM10011511_01450 [Puia dinghuensis]
MKRFAMNFRTNKKAWGRVLRLIFVLVLVYFARELLYPLIDKYIIEEFHVNKVKGSDELDCAFGLLLAFYIYFVGKHWRGKRLVPTLASLVSIAIFYAAYVCIIRQTGHYQLLSLKNVSWFKYLDILYLLATIPMLAFQRLPGKEPAPLAFGFLSDVFAKDQVDLLQRGKYAEQLALRILSVRFLEKAFVIAINSPWGFGKSAFLLLVENNLDSKKERNGNEVPGLRQAQEGTIVVRYNPWKNFDEKKIIHDFLDQLSKELGRYDADLSAKIREYAKALGKASESKLSKFTEAAVEVFFPTASLSELYEQINSRIKRIQKRIVVFIDDLDRLNGSELLDVLRLVRNTANFNNTIFIVAYDHNYVLNTVDKSNQISNKEQYLQKIVQLELTLPTFSDTILLDYLRDQLQQLYKSPVQYDPINNALIALTSYTLPFKIDPAGQVAAQPMSEQELVDFVFQQPTSRDLLFYAMITSIRDVVRLVNSSEMAYASIGDIGDPLEILLLELVKLKGISVYQLIANRHFLTLDKGAYRFEEGNYNLFMSAERCAQLNVRLADKPLIAECLKRLFDPSRTLFFRSVAKPQYFSLYFSYQAPNAVELGKIEDVLAKGAGAVKQLYDDATTGQRADIQSYLYSQEGFASVEAFKSVIQALCIIADDNFRAIFSKVTSLLRDQNVTGKLFNGTGLESFVLGLLGNDVYPLDIRFELAFEELYKLLKEEQRATDTVMLVMDKAALQGVLLHCLQEEIGKKGSYTRNIFNIYTRNISHITDTNHIVLTDEANATMNRLVREQPYTYLKRGFINVHPEPSFTGQYFYFDPFMDQHFNHSFEEELAYLNTHRELAAFGEADRETFAELIALFQLEGYPRAEKVFVEDRRLIAAIKSFIDNTE